MKPTPTPTPEELDAMARRVSAIMCELGILALRRAAPMQKIHTLAEELHALTTAMTTVQKRAAEGLRVVVNNALREPDRDAERGARGRAQVAEPPVTDTDDTE